MISRIVFVPKILWSIVKLDGEHDQYLVRYNLVRSFRNRLFRSLYFLFISTTLGDLCLFACWPVVFLLFVLVWSCLSFFIPLFYTTVVVVSFLSCKLYDFISLFSLLQYYCLFSEFVFSPRILLLSCFLLCSF